MAPAKKEKVSSEEEERLSDSAEEADVEAEDEDTDSAEEADEESESDADAEDESDEDESEDEEEEVKPVKKPAKAPVKRSPAAKSGKKAPARLEESSEEEAESEEEDTDYLQQYQYKKVNDVPTIGGPMTNPDKGSKAERMKVHLLKQPRVRILVARDPGEHHSVLMSVNLNGYRLDFPKNTYVEMPEQVAEVIMQSQKQTDAALEAFKIDGNANQSKRDALNA